MEAKEKTAMQMAIDKFKEYQLNQVKTSWTEVIAILEIYKEGEKQQLINAWNSGIDNCGEFNTPSIATAEQYYQEQFKQ